MGNKKISELNLLTAPQLSTIIPVVEGGETQKLAVGGILNSVLPISASTIVASSITVNGTITANNIISQSIDYYTGSTNHGTHPEDNHTYTGSVLISGSETITGDLTVSGNLFIQYQTELGGNIVPRSPRGATLGTLERPFLDIFVSSGSINIASDIPGDPNTTISNIGGNLLISAGGVRLIGNASFIAATGSFQFISGAMEQIGDYTQTGNYVMVGDKTISGSLKISGSGFINNRRILTDLDSGSFTPTSSFNAFSNSVNTTTASLNSYTSSNNGKWNTLGGQTGSFVTEAETGSFVTNVSMFLSKSAFDTYTGSAANAVSSAINAATSSLSSSNAALDNIQLFTSAFNSYTASVGNVNTSSLATTGSNRFNGNQTITGSLTLSSGSALRINDGLYVNGNKQFNYGQWVSLQTQTGSADTAYAMKLETPTDGLSGFYVGNNGSGFPTRIYSQNTGLYNIQFSAQLHTTSNEAVDFSVWFAMTGSSIPYSNTDFSIEKINGGGFQVAALNFLTPITSGSYVEIYWSKTTANGQLQAKGIQSSPARPATPSLIVTVTQVA